MLLTYCIDQSCSKTFFVGRGGQHRSIIHQHELKPLHESSTSIAKRNDEQLNSWGKRNGNKATKKYLKREQFWRNPQKPMDQWASGRERLARLPRGSRGATNSPRFSLLREDHGSAFDPTDSQGLWLSAGGFRRRFSSFNLFCHFWSMFYYYFLRCNLFWNLLKKWLPNVHALHFGTLSPYAESWKPPRQYVRYAQDLLWIIFYASFSKFLFFSLFTTVLYPCRFTCP